MINKKIFKDIGFLDWSIFISIIIMALMIFLPQIVWEEEDYYKSLRREKMNIISKSEDFYYQLMGEYTLNTKELFSLVESATDSVIADSLFVGDKMIDLDDGSYEVNLERGFEIRVDTTFSVPTELYVSYADTVYSVGMKN